ncbi:protein prkA [Patulibacter sp. NPDC049589]|uniref:protein prkA n=1 Tax=Patulibacter sp. NPDC049589 TaxID=3154731 RepID=UPI0034494693
MSFHQALTEAAQHRTSEPEEVITLNDYLERVAARPTIAATAHQRIHDMIKAAGSAAGPHPGETSFDFFADELFGMDAPLERVVGYFETAAEGHETRRRILLLWGPPGGAKSTIAAMLKRGLEAWSRTDEGAIYALEGCPMHEEPLHLVPQELRAQAREHTSVRIEGELCPVCRFRLDDEYGGDFLRFPIRRVVLSEARRVGIATFEPGDPKSMSMEQLTGGMDWKAIERYGSDAHPLALDWQGEFSKANRGLFEAVELLKNPAEFRNLFLTMAQEKQFKVPKFGYIDADCAIVAHTNEAEFRAFMADPRNEALKDRLVTVAVPYNVRVSDEERIYAKLLGDRGSPGDGGLHIAPHALRAAAMVAVLSRLEAHETLDPMEKLQLYDGVEVGEWKLTQVPEVKREAEHEAMGGLGPRRIVDVLSGAAQRPEGDPQGGRYLTPIMALIALHDHIERMEVGKEERRRLEAFVVDARKEIDRVLKDEVRKAFVPAFAEHAQRVLDNYLTNVEAYCQGTRTKDPITKEDREPDEKLMRAIEEKVKPTVAESAKETFRQGVLMRIGIALRSGERPLSYRTDTILASGIEEYLFDQLQDIVRVTVSRASPDQEQAKRLNEVTRVLCEQGGYNEHSARDLLDYVGHLLNR